MPESADDTITRPCPQCGKPVIVYRQYADIEVPCPACGTSVPPVVEAPAEMPTADTPGGESQARQRGRLDPFTGWGLSLFIHVILLALFVQIGWLVSVGNYQGETEVGVVGPDSGPAMSTVPEPLSPTPATTPPLDLLTPTALTAPPPIEDLSKFAESLAPAPAAKIDAVASANLGNTASAVGMPDAFIDLKLGTSTWTAPSTGGGTPRVGESSGAWDSSKPLPLKDMYRLRTLGGRGKAIEKLGGSAKTEAAVQLALQWLARHQSPDGRWSAAKFMENYEEKGVRCDGAGWPEADVGMTGLATLVFLGAGNTHLAASANSDRKIPYNDCVRKALNWLVDRQKTDGSLCLDSGPKRESRRRMSMMYSHAMATTALAEAFAMTEDQRLEGPVRKAADFIVSAQTPNSGWRYSPKSDSDTSVTGWEIMALKSAGIGGYKVPPPVYRGAMIWLDHVRCGKMGGLYGYTSPSESPSMTAEGLFIEQYMDFNPNTPRVKESIDYILAHKPAEDLRGSGQFYFWYYATLALHQIGGQGWNEWNKATQTVLVESQRKDGPFAGSWDTNMDSHGDTGGRIYTTALGALMLEVYYRYLPFNKVRLKE